MNRIIDKIIIFVLSVFAMCFTMHGNTFLVFLYMSIICSALNYYLIVREREDLQMKPEGAREWIAYVLQIAFVLAGAFYPPAIVILPIIAYDMTRSRNYVGGGLTVMALVNGACHKDSLTSAYGNVINQDTMANMILLYSMALILLAVFLSIKSERNNTLTIKYKRLRDDSEEKRARLNLQNQELINARDTELHNAQLSERNRIARDIHDNVGHTLSRAILQMGALLAIHKEEPIHTELEGVRQTLDSAMVNIRSSVHDLHDDSIDVRTSIKQMAEPLKGKFTLNMEVDISEDMPRNVKYAVIGISKEAISNIIKHSSNSNVDIKLNEHPSMYQLVVHDYNMEGDDKMAAHVSHNFVSGDGHVMVGNSGNYGNAAGHGGAGNTGKSIDSSSHGGAGNYGNATSHGGAGNSNRLDGNKVGMGLENIRSRVESVNGALNISDENGFRIFVTIPR